MKKHYKIYLALLASFFYCINGLIYASPCPCLKLVEPQTLTVCTDAGYAPYEMKDAQGQYFGFEMDLMKDFSQFLEVKLKIIDMKFDGLVAATLSQKCDVIAAAFFKTPEREKNLLFSEVIYKDPLSVAYLNAEKKYKDFKSLKDFDQSGMVFGTRSASLSDSFLTKNLKHATLKRYESEQDMLNALVSKKVHVIVYDETFVKASHLKHKNLSFLRLGEAQSIVIASKKDRTKLIEKFNKFLVDYKKSDKYKSLEDYYFIEAKWLDRLK
jgi:polar amino acid transport system substrate-binding protein